MEVRPLVSITNGDDKKTPLAKSPSAEQPVVRALKSTVDYTGSDRILTTDSNVYQTDTSEDIRKHAGDLFYGTQDTKEIQAQAQPTMDRLGNALGNLGVGAVGFLTTTVGQLANVIPAILPGGKTSDIWDNSISKAGESMNKWAEEVMPLYATHAAEDATWLENLYGKGRGQWWLKEGMGRVALVAGMFLPGAVIGEGLGLSRVAAEATGAAIDAAGAAEKVGFGAADIRNAIEFSKRYTATAAGKAIPNINPLALKFVEGLKGTEQVLGGTIPQMAITAKPTEDAVREYYTNGEGKNEGLTDEQIDKKAMDASNRAFWQAGLTALPTSFIFAKQMFGSFNGAKNLMAKAAGQDAAILALPAELSTSAKIGIGALKAIGTGIESGVNETAQVSIGRAAELWAEGKVKTNDLGDIINTYMNGWKDDPNMQNNMLLGTVQGILESALGPHGMWAQHRRIASGKEKSKTTQIQELQAIINSAALTYHNDMSDYTIKDKDGKPVIDKNGNPSVDMNKVAKTIVGQIGAKRLAEDKMVGALSDNKLIANWSDHNALSGFAQTFFDKQGGIEYVNNFIDAQAKRESEDIKSGIRKNDENHIGMEISPEQRATELKATVLELKKAYKQTQNQKIEVEGVDKMTTEEKISAGNTIQSVKKALYDVQSTQLFIAKQKQNNSEEIIDLSTGVSKDLKQNKDRVAFLERENLNLDNLHAETTKQYDALTDAKNLKSVIEAQSKKDKERVAAIAAFKAAVDAQKAKDDAAKNGTTGPVKTKTTTAKTPLEIHNEQKQSELAPLIKERADADGLGDVKKYTEAKEKIAAVEAKYKLIAENAGLTNTSPVVVNTEKETHTDDSPEVINRTVINDDSNERKAEDIHKSTTGVDDGLHVSRDLFYRTVEHMSNEELAGKKLLVVTKETNPELYSKILEQEPEAARYELDNPEHKGIWTILSNKDGSPYLVDGKFIQSTLETAARVLHEEEGTEGPVGPEGAGAVDVARGAKDAAEAVKMRENAIQSINTLRDDIHSLKKGDVKFLPINGKSKGLSVDNNHSAYEAKGADKSRPFHNIVGRIFKSIKNWNKISIDIPILITEWKGASVEKGKLYIADEHGRVFDLIPRMVNDNESELIHKLIISSMSGTDKAKGFDAIDEVKKIISFRGNPNDTRFQIYLKNGELFYGTQKATLKEVEESKASEVLDFIETKRVNANSKLIGKTDFTFPSLDGNGTKMSYQEYLLGGNDPMFGTDLRKIEEGGKESKRFIQSYLTYDNKLVNNTGVSEKTSAETKKESVILSDPLAPIIGDSAISAVPASDLESKKADVKGSIAGQGTSVELEIVGDTGKPFLLIVDRKGNVSLFSEKQTDGSYKSGDLAPKDEINKLYNKYVSEKTREAISNWVNSFTGSWAAQETQDGKNYDKAEKVLNAELANLKGSKTTTAPASGIKAKKADIEKRRNIEIAEELLDTFETSYSTTLNNEELAKIIKDENVNNEYPEELKEINAKYDAELDALEGGKPAETKFEKVSKKDAINNTPTLDSGFIPEVVAKKAFDKYFEMHKGQTFREINGRGGFGASELDSLYPNWREESVAIRKGETSDGNSKVISEIKDKIKSLQDEFDNDVSLNITEDKYSALIPKDADVTTDEDYYNELSKASAADLKIISDKYTPRISALNAKLEELQKGSDPAKVIKRRSGLDRLASVTKDKSILTQVEKDWFTKNFPNISIKLIEGLISGNSMGRFINASEVLLSDIATVGTLYHEAFHAITQLYLTKDEIDRMYAEAALSNPGKTRKQLEEILAEDFADYKATGKILKANPVRNTFFRRILNTIKDIFGMKATKIQQVYERLDKGFYNSRSMVNNKEFSSLNRSSAVKRFTEEKGTTFVKNVLDGLDVMLFRELYNGNETPIAISSKVGKISDTVHDTILDMYNKETNPEIRADYEYIFDNWNTVMETWSKRLDSNGVNMVIQTELANKELNEEGDIDKADKDASKSDQYSEGNLTSTLESVSSPVRMLLMSLQKVDSDGKPILNNLNFPVPVDFKSTYTYLLKHTAGLGNSYTDLINKIKELSVGKKEFEQLVKVLGEPSSLIDNDRMRFQNQFLLDFNKNRTNSLITTYDSDGNIRIVDANRQNESEKVKTVWENALTEHVKQGEDGALMVDPKILDIKKPLEFLEALGITFDDGTKAVINDKKTFDDKQLNESVAAIKLFITHHKNDVTQLYIQVKDNPNDSPEAKIKKAEDKKVSVIGGRLNYLLNLEAQHTSLVNELSFISSDGKTEYSVNENNGLSITANSINNAKSKQDLFNKLPHLNTIGVEGSIWISQMFDETTGLRNEGVSISLELHNGMQTAEGTNDSISQLTKKGTKADLFTQQIASILNGKSSFIVSSDKSQEYVLSINNYNGTEKLPIPLKAFADGFNNIRLKRIFKNYFKSELKRILAFELDGVGKDIDVYNKNGGKFTVFQDIANSDVKRIVKQKVDELIESKTSLQEFLDSKDDNIEQFIDSIENDINEGLMTFFDRYYNELRVAFGKNGIDAEQGFPLDLLKDNTIESLTRALIVYDLINSIEQTKLFTGDLAFYKDLYKRTSMFAGTKQTVRIDSEYHDWLNANHPRQDGKLADGYENVFVFEDVVTEKQDLQDWVDTFVKENKNNELTKEEKEEHAYSILGYEKNAKGEYVGSSAYGKAEEGDAQGWGSLDFFMEFHRGVGTNTPMMEEAYKIIQLQKFDDEGNLTEGELLKGPSDLSKEDKFKLKIISDKKRIAPELLRKDDLKLEKELLAKQADLKIGQIALFQTLKLQHAGPVNSNKQGSLYIPGGFKFTVMPLIPQMIAGKNLSKVLKNMQDNKSGIGLFKSGSKFGTIVNEKTGKPNKFYENNNNGEINSDGLITQSISYQYLGLQVKPSSPHSTAILSTQFRKTPLINAFENGKESFVGAKDMLDELNSLYEQRARNDKDSLIKSLGFNPDSNKIEDATALVQLLTDSSEDRKLADNIVDSLDIEEVNGKKQLKYSISSMVNKAKIDSVLMSLINNRLIKQKFNGEAYVLATVAGMEKIGPRNIGSNSALRGYTQDKDGNTIPAECMVPMSKNYYALLKRYNGNLKALNSAIKNGEIDARVLELIGCRIPGQGQNSNEYLTISEFLPEDAATSMVVHPDIVAKAGSDFDNDKLYTYRPNLDRNGEYKIDDLDNKIINITKGFISHPNNFTALITPNSTRIIEEITNKIKHAKYVNKKILAGEEPSLIEGYLKHQKNAASNIRYTDNLKLHKKVDARHKLWLAKDEVGPAAIANSYGPLSQIAGLTANKEYWTGEVDKFGQRIMATVTINMPHNKIGNKINLGAIKDANGINNISETNNQTINIVVDAAKEEEPIVAHLNMTMETLPIYLYLNKIGVPFEFIANFMAQPIITEYLEQTSVNKSIHLKATNKSAPFGVSDDVQAKYSGSDGKTPPRKGEMVLSELENALLSKNQSGLEFNKLQLQVLKDFKAYKKQARLFNDYVRITNSDSTGVGKNINASRLKRMDTRQTLSRDFINGVDRVMNDTFLKSFNQVQFSIDAYSPLYDTQDGEVINALIGMSDQSSFTSEDDRIKSITTVENDFINFVIQKYGYTNTKELRNSLFKGDKSVAKEILTLKTKKASDCSKDELKLRENILIKQLFPLIDKAKPGSGFDNVKIYSKKLDVFTQNQLTDAFREIRDINPLLFKRLVDLSILQSGLNNSPITFLGLTPFEYYNDLVKKAFSKFNESDKTNDIKEFGILNSLNQKQKIGHGMYGKDFSGITSTEKNVAPKEASNATTSSVAQESIAFDEATASDMEQSKGMFDSETGEFIDGGAFNNKAKISDSKQATSVKPAIDLNREWKGDLESRPVYTKEGINTMRTTSAKPNEHFGNPFSEAGYGNTIKVDSIADAVLAYKDWLLNGVTLVKTTNKVNLDTYLKPFEVQRTWILNQINQGKLDGATLLYAGKSAARGQGMHPTALAEVVEQLRSKPTQTSTSVSTDNNTKTPIEGLNERLNAYGDAKVVLPSNFYEGATPVGRLNSFKSSIASVADNLQILADLNLNEFDFLTENDKKRLDALRPLAKELNKLNTGDISLASTRTVAVEKRYAQLTNKLTNEFVDIVGKHVEQQLSKKISSTQPSTSVERESSIVKNNWTKDSPKENPNTAYIFTENINSIGSSRVGGGSAVIRNNPNAIGIVTKKYYVYAEDRATSKVTGGWNQDFQNTKEDFELFKKVNLEQFAKIDKYESKIFPQGFASDLAKIPTRFAEWLQSELLNRYGLVTELNANKTGLISKSITQPSTSVKESTNKLQDSEKSSILSESEFDKIAADSGLPISELGISLKDWNSYTKEKQDNIKKCN